MGNIKMSHIIEEVYLIIYQPFLISPLSMSIATPFTKTEYFSTMTAVGPYFIVKVCGGKK